MSNIVSFPSPKPRPEKGHPSKVDPIKLHDGAVVLTQRPDTKSDSWHYAIKTNTGIERKSCKTADFEKAKQIALDRYQQVDWLQRKGMTAQACTFKQAAEAYLEDAKFRAKHAVNRKHSLLRQDIGIITQHLIPFFNKAIGMIDEKDVRAYHIAYQKNWETNVGKNKFGPKAPTANSMAYAEYLINKICAFALEKKMIVANEVPRFRLTEASTRVRAGFSDGEMGRILKWMKRRIELERSHVVHAYAREMSYLYVWWLSLTGMRPGSEPLHVRYCDIEDRANASHPHVIVKVTEGKTGARSVVVDRGVLQIVDRLKEMHENPGPNCYIFNNPKRTRSANFSRMFGIVLDELGIENDANGQLRSLYSIRHYYITKKILEGRNQALVAKNCGTSIEMISKHYAHLFVETQAAQLLE